MALDTHRQVVMQFVCANVMLHPPLQRSWQRAESRHLHCWPAATTALCVVSLCD